MIKLTKNELEEVKAKLRAEIEVCEECQLEEKLGFKRCLYHNHIISFLKNNVTIKEECGKCHKETYIAESEGILSSGEHFPIGQCSNCGYEFPSWFKEE